MVDQSFVTDVAVIGSGPGGYVAAIKLAQLGKRVICIDNNILPGGTCLNVGCIPSKALLQSSYKYHEAKTKFAQHGIIATHLELSLATMMKRKNEVVKSLGNGIHSLFKKNDIHYINGHARLVRSNEIEVMSKINTALTTEDGALSTSQVATTSSITHIKADQIIIATGSKVFCPDHITIDEEYILSSNGSLVLNDVPKTMVVIGGGVIGLEMGSIWSRLGTEVTIIEYSNRIIPSFDEDISRETQKILEKQGIKFILSAEVQKVEKIEQQVTSNTEASIYNIIKNKVNVIYRSINTNLHNQNINNINNDINNTKNNINIMNHTVNQILNCDVVLVAVGRKSNTKNLGLENIGITINHKAQIEVNKNFETNIPGIYAIGDVINGPMLAHKASEEGIAVAEIISGHNFYLNYDAIPNVIYTHPEIASIGKTESELKKANIEYKIGKFPFVANSRARANGDTDGFVKIIACAKTNTILGCSLICENAGELIHQMTIALEFKATAEDIAIISHAHPTLSEAIKEAAYAVYSKPIHL